MVDSERWAEFMGKVETSLHGIERRLDAGEERFKYLEKAQRENSQKIDRLYTGLWIGRVGIGLLATLIGILGYLGIYHPPNGR